MKTLPRFPYIPIVALVITSLLGCDPIVSIDGTVKRTSGIAVVGAKVGVKDSSLDGGGITARTDAQGAFSADRIGCIERSSILDLTVLGEPVRHFSVGDYCVAKDGRCCRRLHADLVIPEAGLP
jgi:hypothetical protein